MGSWSGLLTLSLGALIFSLGTAELYVRQFYVFTPSIQIGTGGTRLSDEMIRSVFEADPETIWRLRANLGVVEEHFAFRGLLSNPQRVRSTQIISAKKAPNEIRILFLGDSVTFGWGVRHDETFSSRTEQMLDERFPELTTTSINTGVPGFSLFQGWRLLESEGLEYQPDLVVVNFGSNDGTLWGSGSTGDIEIFEQWQAEQPPGWLAWSSLARLAANALWSPPPGVAGPPRPRLTIEEFRDLLERVREESRAHGASMLIMVSPFRKDLDGTRIQVYRDHYQQEAIQFGRSLRLGATPEPALLDAVSLFQEVLAGGPPSDLLLDHIHPNAAGHEVLAEALVARIAPWIEERMRLEEIATSSRRSSQ